MRWPCDRAEEVRDLRVAAQCLGHAYPSTDDGKDGQNDERSQHDPRAFMHAVAMSVIVVRGCLCTAFAEEGQIPEPEHVEGCQPGGEQPDKPEKLAKGVR